MEHATRWSRAPRRPYSLVLIAVTATAVLAACVATGTPIMVPDPTDADRALSKTPMSISAVHEERYGPAPEHRVAYALPSNPTAQAMVVFVHGGGWHSGDYSQVPIEIARETARGYVLASIDYRLAPEHPHPAALTDVKRAVRWAKGNADRLGIRPDRVILVGHSAGGHLSLLTAETVGEDEPTDLPPEQEVVDSRPAGVIAGSPATDLAKLMTDPDGMARPWARHLVGQLLGCQDEEGTYDGTFCAPGVVDQASPIRRVAPGQPPVYMITGGRDDMAPPDEQGLPFAVAHAHSGAHTAYDLADEAGHDAIMFAKASAIDAFLDRVIGLHTPATSTSTSTSDPQSAAAPSRLEPSGGPTPR